ncbi:MAG: hypothetical protein HY706_13980 [Candidatus Hydrogenedentes bacterium]|nr:hypothetical protein [Candidatus Hydrogenedentota bacterium]
MIILTFNCYLAKQGFGAMVEAECAPYYADVLGRPGPGSVCVSAWRAMT